MPPPASPTATPATITRLSETLHLFSLALWLGAVVMSGVVAAVVFPLVRELDPTLGAYPEFTGDHANLAAGRIAARVFLIADGAQFAGAFLALVTVTALILRGAISNRRLAHGVRVVALAVALTSVSYQLLLLAPRMDRNLSAYWAAAEAGDNQAAETARLAFAEDHPTASRTLSITALAVATSLGFGLWSCQAPRVARREGAGGPGEATDG
ncbi:MAG: hypothetical protein ACF8Q5_15000 [Phycisphaerales bacterium JB040]